MLLSFQHWGWSGKGPPRTHWLAISVTSRFGERARLRKRRQAAGRKAPKAILGPSHTQRMK